MLGLTGLAFLLAFLMLSPYAAYILGGVVLGFVARPLHLRLNDYVEESVSSFLTVLLTVLCFIVPFAVLLIVVAGDATSLLSKLEGLDFGFLRAFEQRILEFSGVELDLEDRIVSAAESFVSLALGSLSSVLGAATSVAIGVSLMLFLQFYVIRDGKEFVEWTKDFDFMSREMQEDLYSRMSSSTWSVVKGHVFIALIQGLFVGFGFLVLGVSNPFFWTLLMILLGFIPLVGSLLVWLPASIYLIAAGSVVSGAVLLVYSLVVTTLSDNFLRPFLVDEDADIHPFFVVVGVVGGIGVFGPAGVFLGPVTFGVLKTLLNTIREHYTEL